MEFFHDQTSKALLLPNLKHNKKRLTEEQVRLLERSFTTSKKLEPELKQNLANRLGVPPRQVAIWYQNKRVRWKTQTLEVGYKALQVQLEHVTAEKKRLEREVKHLQAELKKAQEMLFCLTNQGQNVNPSVSCEEGGSSGAGGFNHGDSQLVDDELFHLCMFDWCK